MEEVTHCTDCEKAYTCKIFKCTKCNVRMVEQPCPMFEKCFKCDICHIVHRNGTHLIKHSHKSDISKKNMLAMS